MTHVLIVDDHAGNLYLLRALLQGHGYTVDEARNGAEALAIARKTPPDLIVSDLLMPVMDGYTLLRHWKTDERLKSVPFVVYTATYIEPKDERLALNLGADAFLVKPAEPDVFMARISEVLAAESRGQLTPAAGLQVEESLLLRDYNEVLIRKLEKKARQLEQSNRELQEEIAERRKSEAHRQAVWQSSLDAIVVMDEAGLISDFNPAAERIFGYRAADVIGQSLADTLIPPAHRNAHQAGLARFLSTGISHILGKHIEVSALRSDGAEFPVELTVIQVASAERPLFIGMARDISERRQSEAQVQQTTELLQAVADGMTDSVFVKDRAGRYLLFNAAAERVVGKSAEAVLGRDDSAIFGPEDAQAMTASDQLVLETQQTQTIVDQLQTVDGPRIFQSIKTPYRDRAGNVIGIIGVARDITELKRTEETLRLRDRAIQAVSQGILITDPNQPDNPIIYASSGFERMTGYKADEVIGRNCRLLQGKETDQAAVREIRQAVAEGRSCSVEILNYRRDGTPFWNQLTISPVPGPDGQLMHFVGVQTDITEHRRLEEQLRQAQKMEAFGQLAGGVAHDFNNLLTIISGYSDILLSMLPTDDSMREAVKAISEAGERAASLTRQMLAFSRQTVLMPQVLDLNVIVGETEKMLRRLIGEDILLTTVLDPKVSLVRVDSGHLGQVLMNLAVNARDAMPRGGRLTIETRNVVLDEHYATLHLETKAGDYVMLAVSDTGEGMTPEIKARIFEPFFTTKGVGKGTGLGLAVVHGIVKQSGGSIEVYSEPGLGTSFKLYFPAVASAAQTGRVEARKARPGTETILLVEDEDSVRGLAVLALQTHGYTVLAAGSGKEALRLAEEHAGRFSLLVTDVVMPGMGGSQLAETLRDRIPSLKVLFLSGYTDDAVVRHGILQEQVAFLQKPFSPLMLAVKVREMLDA
jgi:PAS domain S-box-containing protein